jgi:hypothetical protein
METETLVAPVEFEKENNTFNDLEKTCNEIFEKINHCDEQVAAWQKYKTELQTHLANTFNRIQKQFGIEQPEKHSAKNITTAELILSFLAKNGPARTSEIRKFLLDNGKKTAPGVPLGRLVKDKSIENVERGVYKLV